jgi:hypothetical protein
MLWELKRYFGHIGIDFRRRRTFFSYLGCESVLLFESYELALMLRQLQAASETTSSNPPYR